MLRRRSGAGRVRECSCRPASRWRRSRMRQFRVCQGLASFWVGGTAGDVPGAQPIGNADLRARYRWQRSPHERNRAQSAALVFSHCPDHPSEDCLLPRSARQASTFAAGSDYLLGAILLSRIPIEGTPTGTSTSRCCSNLSDRSGYFAGLLGDRQAMALVAIAMFSIVPMVFLHRRLMTLGSSMNPIEAA